MSGVWAGVLAAVLLAGLLAAGVAVVLWARKRYREAAEHERQREWYATVIAVHQQYVHTGGQGLQKKLMLTVRYRRDDGTVGRLDAYEGNLRVHFGVWHDEAPPFSALVAMREGDRLFKPLGRLHPEKIRG